LKYEIMYLDPPWHRTPNGTARTPYKTMSWAELEAFDLGAWLARDAMVYCWMTGPTQLRESAVLLRWCERFGLHEAGTAYQWIKTKKPQPERAEKLRSIVLSFASTDAERRDALAEFEEMGGVDGATPIGASGPRPKAVKQVHSDRVIALTTSKRGRVFPLLTEAQCQLIYWPKPRKGEHSRKPPEVRDRIVELLGDRPRIELFARKRVPGWHSDGDELPPLSFPVTDDALDAPDSACVDGYERRGDLWVWRDEPAWEQKAA
jgi:N6-adenosine-specific RNA methylase IME4